MKIPISSLILLVALVSCVGHGVLSHDKQSLIGPVVGVGVIPIRMSSQISTPFLYRSGPGMKERVSGAGKDALSGMKSGASLGKLWISPPCYGQGCLVGLVPALPTAIVGAAGGSVAGAVSGALSGAPQLDPEVTVAVENLGIPETLRDRICETLKDLPGRQFSSVSYPPDYTPFHGQRLYDELAKSNIETFLELTLSSMRFIGNADNGPHQFSITVHSRLIKTTGYGVLDQRYWEYSSEGHSLEEWKADNGRVLGENLETFYVTIAENVKNELFSAFVTPIP